MPKTCEPVRLRFMEREDTFEVEVPTIWESAHFAVHECVRDLTWDRKPQFEELPRNRWFRLIHKASGLAFGTAHRQKLAIRYGKLAEDVLGDRPSDDLLLKDFHTWMVFGQPWDFFNETKAPADLPGHWNAWKSNREANAARAKSLAQRAEQASKTS